MLKNTFENHFEHDREVRVVILLLSSNTTRLGLLHLLPLSLSHSPRDQHPLHLKLLLLLSPHHAVMSKSV